jgi:DNA-binding CsgD family transcriptional regulator
MILKKMHGENIKDPSSVHLNEREVDILRLICKQKTNHEIADALCMSKNTINSYRNKLLDKTNSLNTAGLVVYAIKNGYFTIS